MRLRTPGVFVPDSACYVRLRCTHGGPIRGEEGRARETEKCRKVLIPFSDSGPQLQ
jgi:hypothetical protein